MGFQIGEGCLQCPSFHTHPPLPHVLRIGVFFSLSLNPLKHCLPLSLKSESIAQAGIFFFEMPSLTVHKKGLLGA